MLDGLLGEVPSVYGDDIWFWNVFVYRIYGRVYPIIISNCNNFRRFCDWFQKICEQYSNAEQ